MVALKINGKTYQADVEGDTPLLWVLRDTIGLTGTKFGCGAGLCGACTVHVDGRPMRSCSLAVSAMAGKEITTIESIAEVKDHPVIAAWIEEQVPQCGYCQAGQIMAATALLKRNPKPRQKVMIDDPFIASWCLGIQSAESPPRSRCCRRPQFEHELNRNVGALNPVCPLRTASLYLSVQLFNRSEFILCQRAPNDRLQIYIASFRHEISTGQRAG